MNTKIEEQHEAWIEAARQRTLTEREAWVKNARESVEFDTQQIQRWMSKKNRDEEHLAWLEAALKEWQGATA